MTTPVSERSRLSSLLVGLGALLLSLGWAFSMPIGAGPDEPAHVIKAASVVRGEFIGEPTEAPAVTNVTVPASLAIASAWPCFAFEPTVAASCQVGLADDATPTRAETSAGIYNPGYYLVVGWPSLLTADPTAAVWGMRALTALVSAALIGGVHLVLTRLMSRLAATTLVAAAATPMVFFLNAVVNPNAWEITGGLAFFVGLLWFATSDRVRGRAAVAPAILIGVGGVLAANARGVSPFWLFVLGLVFLVAAPWPRIRELVRTPAFLIGLGVAVAGALGGAAWTLATGTLNRMGDFPGQSMTPVSAFIRMVLVGPSDPGLIGFFGWLDTPAPGIVYAAYGFSSLLLVVLALAVADRRGRLLVIVSVVVFLAGPALLQAASVRNSGYIWQGRYSLVVFVAMLVVCGFVIASSTRSWQPARELPGAPTSRFLVLALVVLGVAQFWAFFGNLQRYAVASSGSVPDTFLAPDWAPPVLGTLGVTAIALLGLAVIVFDAVIAQRGARALPLRALATGPDTRALAK